MSSLQFNTLCVYDLTKGFLFVEDPGPEDTRTDVTLVPDPILIPIGDVLEADRTHQNTVVEGAVVILPCPTGEGTLAAEYVMFIKAEYQRNNCCFYQSSPGYLQAEFDLLCCHWGIQELSGSGGYVWGNLCPYSCALIEPATGREVVEVN